MARVVDSYVLIVPDAALAVKANCSEENNCCQNTSCSGDRTGAGADAPWAEWGRCNGQVRNGLGSLIYIFVERHRAGATRTGQVQVDGRRGGDAAAIRLADAKAVLANIATETPQQRQRLNAEHTGGILFWAPPEVQAKKRPNLRRRKARRAQKRTALDNNFFS